MSKTCKCEHEKEAHNWGTHGYCAAPMCLCREFVEAKPVPASPAERDAENKVVLAYWKERVERLELERDAQTLVLECVKADLSRSRDAHNAAIRERDALKVRAERALEERDAAMRGAAELANQLRTAESALGEAKREGAREALLGCARMFGPASDSGLACIGFRDREYPAIDPVSGSTCKPDCARVGYCAPGTGCHAPASGSFGGVGVRIASTGGLGHTTTTHVNPAHISPTYTQPATPSGEGVTYTTATVLGRATPQPEAEPIYVPVTDRNSNWIGNAHVTAPLARRLLALAQTGEGV